MMSLMRSGVLMVLTAALLVEAYPQMMHTNRLQPEMGMLHRPSIPPPGFIVPITPSKPAASWGGATQGGTVVAPKPLRPTAHTPSRPALPGGSAQGGSILTHQGSPQQGRFPQRPTPQQPSPFQPSSAHIQRFPTTTTTTTTHAPVHAATNIHAPARGTVPVPVSASAKPAAIPGKYRDPLCGVVPDPGECRGAFPRYFFNSTTNQCDCFLYGGCPSANTHATYTSLNECIGHCSPDNPEEGPQCKEIFKDAHKSFSFPVKPQEEVVKHDHAGHSQGGHHQHHHQHQQQHPPRPGTVGGVPFPDTSHLSQKELFDMLQRSTKEDQRQQDY